MTLRRRCARPPRPRSVATLTVALAVAALFIGAPARARADDIGVTVYSDAGFRLSAFTGAVGRVSSRGLGIAVTQGIQRDWLGGYLRLGTDYRLTTQQAPPFGHGLHTYDVALGARLVLPKVAGIDPAVTAEYASVGMLANPLVAVTGDRSRYHAAGVGATARLRFGAAYAELGGVVRLMPAMTQLSPWFGATLSAGIAGR
jgi:hypothetical protein